ncbi:MAG: porin [Planctomycetaceae bacterium]
MAQGRLLFALLVLTPLNFGLAQADDAATAFFSESDSPLFIQDSGLLLDSAPPEIIGPDTDADPVDTRFEALEKDLKALKASLEKKDAPKPATPPAVVYPTVKVTGFFQADAGWLTQDSASRQQFGDIQDNRAFRRTRLAAVGKVAENVSYMLEMDFAFNGRPSFMDVWMDIANMIPVGTVRIGQWRQPFGLNELTSVKELTFLERPSMFGMSPFRQIGVGFHDVSGDENVTWAASVFGSATDAFGNSIGDRGYGAAARLTKVLMEDQCSDFLVHSGVGYSYVANPNKTIEYRNVPEFGGALAVPGTIPFFVDTLPIPADHANLLNGELAGTWGPLHAQSELRYALVDTKNGGTLVFPSAYAQLGWILTGEHRPYNKQSAALGRIKPRSVLGVKCGGSGAWELAIRYSWIDLNQGTVTGGELKNTAYGVNWYLNDYTKIQFNYINADLNRAPVGNSDTHIFAMRAQLDF